MKTFLTRTTCVSTFLTAVLASSFLTSCQDEDFGYSADQIKYEKSFTDVYGKIPSDKSWDFSSYAKRSTSSPETRATRAGDGSLDLNDEYSIGNWWEVPSQTLAWMERALIEGHDNTYLGSNFVLQLPQNDFAIIPIYQGRSSIHSELEIKINGYDIKSIWNKGDNILVNDHTLTVDQIKDLAMPQNGGIIKSGCEAGNFWHEVGYYIGWASGENPKDIHSEMSMTDLKAMDEAYKCDKYPSYTDEASRVLTKPIYFDYSKIGVEGNGYMYLSLHNTGKAWAKWEGEGYEGRWDKNNQSTTIGHRLTSLNQNNYMLALNVTGDAKPTAAQLSSINLANNRSANPPQVLMIACEDANGPDSDMDINDVVFLIVGYPDVPTVVPTKQVIEKRYMCEDLGGTFDYDFNDIVVDLKQVQEYEIISTPADFSDPTSSDNITITEMRKVGCPIQTAKVSRLCGTIPLQIQVGAYVFPKITDPTDMYKTREDLAGSGYLINPHTHGCHNCELNTRAHGDALNQDGSAKGWNPNEERVIPCHTWDPDKNNITIWADWGYRDGNWHEVTAEWENKHESNPFPENSQDFADFSNGRKVPVTFPEKGQAPYIIAFDPSIPWMEEGKRIPDAWLRGEDLSVVNPETGADRDNIDKVGNSFYMENYPAPDGEGRIWEDNLTGLAYGTGVAIKSGTAEFEAYKEAISHQYYVMHVYTQKPKSGESSQIALYLADSWNPNDKNDHGTPLVKAQDPDDYYGLPLSGRVHATYQNVGSDFQCTTIYLTSDQRTAIASHGVAVVSCIDGLVIRKITMARPCFYEGSTVLRDNGRVMIDPGFTVQFTTSEITNGRVMADDSERAKDVVPYQSARYISGTQVTLTAIGNKGYKLDHWTVNSDDQTTNPLTLTHTASSESEDFVFNVIPVFAQAVDPELKFTDGSTEVSLTLAINGAASNPYQLTASSLNKSTTLGTFGVNNTMIDVTPSVSGDNHILSINPKAVGETEFIVYQPDGTYNSIGYGVSGELKVKVKVIEQLPNVSSQTSLGNWAMYQWSGTGADAHIINKVDGAVNYNADITTDGSHQIFSGNAYGNCYRYVDLPHAKWLVAEVNSGNIEFKFNTELKSDGNEIEGNSITIDANSKEYCVVVDNGKAGTKTYLINIEALRNKYGYVHLNSVRALWQQTANVAWIKADNDYSEIRAEWNKLIGKQNPEMDNATVDLLASDIYHWNGKDQSATVADQNGTVGTTAEDAALAGGNPDSRPFTYVYYKVPVTSQGMNIYGHKDSYPDYYVDLSSANILVVNLDKANTNSIYFQFNKTGWNDADVTKISANDVNYCSVKVDDNSITYVVDLDEIRDKVTKTNYLHLNAITVSWNGTNAKAKINSLKVDSKESAAVKGWKDSQKQDPNASVSSTSINLDGNATYELKFKSDNNGAWPTLSDPNGLVEVLNGENHNGAIDGEFIKFVIRGKKAGSGKITITQEASGSYNAASVDVNVNVTCPGYGYRVSLVEKEEFKGRQSGETWYFEWLNNVLSLIDNTDKSKGMKFTFNLQGSGLMNFNIGSNKGDSGMKIELFRDGTAQNGATWDSGSRKLTYIMSSDVLKEYFDGTSSFYVGGNINTSTLTVQLYVEAVN